MSLLRVLTHTFIIVLCLRSSLNQKTIPIHKRCIQDNDCPIGQFCKDDKVCDSCITCKDHNRNTGLRSSCLKDEAECGSCLDGYDEVRLRYDHAVKRCLKRTELTATKDKKRDFVPVEGSSEEAPSHTTATAITIVIVFIAVGAVGAAMIGVYMYMKRSRTADAGKPDDDDDGDVTKKRRRDLPRVVELLQTIVHANPNLARRQESEDEINARQTETSPISRIEEEESESDRKQMEEEESNRATLPLGSDSHEKDTTVTDEH